MLWNRTIELTSWDNGANKNGFYQLLEQLVEAISRNSGGLRPVAQSASLIASSPTGFRPVGYQDYSCAHGLFKGRPD
jgi:hypothetical protein